MSQTLGSQTRVRFDRRDRLHPEAVERDLRRILELVVEVRRVFEQAADGGVYPSRGESNGRGKGFTDLRPTESAAFSPTQRQLRAVARQAADRIAEARSDLEDAANTLHAGLFRSDPEVLARFLEKRQAATQRRVGGRG